MMEKNGRMQELDSLQKLLDGHGGDRTRWPASERLRFAPLIGGDEEARRRIAEAEALDRILDKAPTSSCCPVRPHRDFGASRSAGAACSR